MNTTKILLIDDHAMFRSGLRMVLNSRLHHAEVLEAGSLNQASQRVTDSVDIILLDINLPGLNGLDGIAVLKRKWPLVPIIVLSSQDDPDTMRDAVARGAVRFISKAESADRIIALINRVLNGEYEAIEPQANNIEEVSAVPLHLTARQCEVLDLLCQGMSNKLIARRLDVSENTVRSHVQAVLNYLHVTSRAEASFAARRMGLIG